MDRGMEAILPVLFWMLAGFASINVIINLVLLYIRRERINRLLSIFWPAVLAVILTQSFFQQGELAIIMAYSATFVSLSLLAMISFESIGKQFPLRPYLLYYGVTYLLTLSLAAAGFSFTITALPVAIGTGTGCLHYAWYALLKYSTETTRLQKLLAYICIAAAIHCINFALFRMEPGAQLWGWVATYAIYDSFAIILPAIALEKVYLSEKKRLQQLIDERTSALDASLSKNRILLKILLHDIYNPLSVIGMYVNNMRPETPPGEAVVSSLQGAQMALEEIVSNVKLLNHNDGAMQGEVSAIQACCRESIQLFDSTLQQKGLTLTFNSRVDEDSRVPVERNLFTHSVVGNLLSNAIKFSPINSEIQLLIFQKQDLVILEIKDKGEGFTQETLARLNNNETVESRKGTQGESGRGVGLSITRAIVESAQGTLTFNTAGGAIIRLTLPTVSPKHVGACPAGDSPCGNT